MKRIPTCPGCLERERRSSRRCCSASTIWSHRIRELEGCWGKNAPFLIPPWPTHPPRPNPVVTQAFRTAQFRTTRILPPASAFARERVQHVIPLIPTHCECFATAPLPQQPSATTEPVWHQFRRTARVTAIVPISRDARTCPDCGPVTHESIPAEIACHCAAFARFLGAVVMYLGGCQHVSQALEDSSRAFSASPSLLGTVDTLQDNEPGA